MMSNSTAPVSPTYCSVGDALDQAGVPALRLITVTEREDLVILTGRLPSYYLKQLAQEAALPHLGQRCLENRILVVQH
ncbi:MAG: BON domain-containing protein [Gemmatales bacterium]